MKTDNIYELSKDRPLKSNEIFQPNDFYGHASILKKYVKLPENYQIKAAIEHGAGIGGNIWDQNIKNILPAIFTSSYYRSRILKNNTQKKIFVIGPKIQYAKHYLTEEELQIKKEKLGKNLLSFPTHSTHYVNSHYDIQKYCQVLKELGKDYKSIRVCLYWKDILRGLDKEYKRNGFEVETAGHMFDPLFLSRLKSIIETATFTTSNNIGTILGYCIILKKPHLLAESEIKRDSLYSNKLAECSDLTNQPDANEIREAFTEIQENITPKQKEIVNKYWGVSEFNSIEEMDAIIKECEELYQKGTGVYNSQNKQKNSEYLFNGSFDEVLQDISKVIGTYPRRKKGALKINNRAIYFCDLHSFYFQSMQIFKQNLYGFKSDARNPVILDCGAHIGLASIFFSEKYPNSEIYAYEADPEISKILDHNIKSLGLKNVKTISKAVWIDEQGVSFKNSGDDSGYINKTDEGNGIKIPSFRIRNFLNEKHVDLLKLDIEGAEFDVIEDCDGVLANAKNIIIEVHKFRENYGSLGSILKTLEKNNFEYALGDLHPADWIETSSAPPLLALQSDKFIVTVFAWQKAKKSVKYEKKFESKVVHICTQDFGGAGKAAYRLHKGLQKVGVDSTMLVVNKQSGDPSVKVFPSEYLGSVKQSLNIPSYGSPLWRQQMLRWQNELTKYPNRPGGLEMFTDALSDIQLEQVQEIRDADIINLHWVAGSLDYPNAPLALRDKQIVWTLHDMNPLTGGCHYSGDCEKYQERCGACPQLGSNIQEDLARQNWDQKFYAFQNLDLNIVTPSKWLADCASKSSLLSKFPITVMPYGFPLDTFKPYPKSDIRKPLNIPENARVILFGADSIVNARKGFVYLLEAIKRLPLNKEFTTVVLTFGGFPEGLQIETKHKIYNLGSIADENKLALAYSAADVFVIPSLEDNLPNTVVEAMACGVPVVGFDIGGIPDMIVHKKNGFLARPRDIDSLLEGIEWAISPPNGGKNISAFCREPVETKYALEVQANAYKEMYDAIIKKQSLKSEDTPTVQGKLDHSRLRNTEGDRIKRGGDDLKDTEKDEQVVPKAKTNKYLVSAIVSTYNAEQFIRGRLEDLENQTLADKLEIVVINSGSQQNEEKIIREFQDKYSNIKYIKTNQRETVYAAWNRGIKASQGRYITNANTDDRLRQDAFEVMVNTLEAHPEIALVYADVIITETENENFEGCTPAGFFNWLNFDREHLLNKGCFVGPQPMWRREIHDEYGYFDPSFVTSGDYEFWLRISQTNTFMHLPIQLGLYLRSPGSIEHANRERQRGENDRILNMYQKARASGKLIGRIPVGTSHGHSETRSKDTKSPESIYQSIKAEMENKPPEEVVHELEMLAESFPQFAPVYNDLGVLYYQASEKEKAHQLYEKAVQLDPGNMVFQKNLADFYCVEMGRVEDALQIYVKILELNPQDIETLLITGHICVALHNFEDAKVFYRRVLELEPQNEDAQSNLNKLDNRNPVTPELKSPEELYQEIQPLLNNGDPHRAIAQLEELLQAYPDFALAQNDLGVLYYHTGDKEKARHHYESAVDLMPDNINFQKNLADFLFVEQGKVEEALQIYVNILATHPEDVETLLISGHICVALKKFDDAKEFYKRVLALAPDNEDASKNLQALMSRQVERPHAKLDSLNDVTASSAKNKSTDPYPEESETQDIENKSIVSIVVPLDGIQNRVKECLKSIQEHTVEPHELLLVDSGATKGMLKWAQQLIKDKDNYHIIECGRRPGWAESLNRAIQKAAGEIMVLLHNDVVVPESWLKAFEMGIKLEPNIGVVGPMSNRAGGIQQLMNPDESDRIEFEYAAKAFRQQNQYRRVVTRKLAGFCLVFQRDLPDTIGYFDEQFASEEMIVEDFCNRSVAGGYQNLIAADTYVFHYDRHKVKKNASTEKMAGGEDQKKYNEKWNSTQNPEAKALQTLQYISNANELSQKGQIDEAVEILLNAIRVQTEEKRLYLELAEILVAAKRFQAAKDVLNEMPSENGNPEIRKVLLSGYTEEGLENYEAARACVEQVLAINPTYARGFNLKGILAYRNNDRNSATKYFKRAIASDPGYGEPYTNLGMLQLETEQPEEALKFFEKGFILSPTDLDIATNYHAFIEGFGDFEKTEDVARQAAELYPNNRKIKYMLIDSLIRQSRYEMAMPEIEDAIIKFGIADGILGAALKVREKLGSMTINKSSKKAPVSLCMIIKDEETYLARCLASVKPIVDEMIVVDTGSTDRSKDIAITFGAKVYDYEWRDDFAAARNYSISKASGEWILILDGDEVISHLDHADFNKLVKKIPGAPIAYSITTRNYSKVPNIVGWVPNDGQYPDEEGTFGWLPSEKVRVFYGKDQIRFEGAVHEMVDPLLKRNGIEVKKCRIPVHHYGRLDQEKLGRKGETYFDIGLKKLSEMGEDVRALWELAIQATVLEKNQQALELWQRLLALNPNPKMAANVYVNMGNIYNRLGIFEDALNAGKKAVEYDPDLKEAQYNQALAELQCGNAPNTISILESLLNSFPDYPPAQFILSAAYCCAGPKEKGLDGIRKLKNTPLGAHLEIPCLELAQSLLAAKKVEYALRVLGAAIECDIINKEILDLFTECIQMNDKAQQLSEIPPTGLTNRQPIKFENLPQ
jgi:FkbM family methyltransferase